MQLSILVVVGVLCLVVAQERPTLPTPTIIYGTPAEEGEIPWQALLFNARNGSDVGNRCGASLIRPNWILTAAHCITGSDFTQVSMGSVSIERMTFSSRSYHRIVHPEYERSILLNDIALVKMPENAPEGATIQVIPHPDASIGDLTGQQAVVSGFGLTESGQVSNELLKVNLQVISNEECRQTYGDVHNQPTKLCARWITREGESSCFGDSGGPLTTEFNGQRNVVGIVSSGSFTTCDSGDESVYTRVSEYKDWIDQTIASN